MTAMSIPPYYDSLIGKLIVHGAGPRGLLMRLDRALHELIVDGVETTSRSSSRCSRSPEIRAAPIDIHWLERWLEAERRLRRAVRGARPPAHPAPPAPAGPRQRGEGGWSRRPIRKERSYVGP